MANMKFDPDLETPDDPFTTAFRAGEPVKFTATLEHRPILGSWGPVAWSPIVDLFIEDPNGFKEKFPKKVQPGVRSGQPNCIWDDRTVFTVPGTYYAQVVYNGELGTDRASSRRLEFTVAKEEQVGPLPNELFPFGVIPRVRARIRAAISGLIPSFPGIPIPPGLG